MRSRPRQPDGYRAAGQCRARERVAIGGAWGLSVQANRAVMRRSLDRFRCLSGGVRARTRGRLRVCCEATIAIPDDRGGRRALVRGVSGPFSTPARAARGRARGEPGAHTGADAASTSAQCHRVIPPPDTCISRGADVRGGSTPSPCLPSERAQPLRHRACRIGSDPFNAVNAPGRIRPCVSGIGPTIATLPIS